jgi:hypothetical protein
MLGFDIPTGSVSVVAVHLGTDCGPESPITIIECEPAWRCWTSASIKETFAIPFAVTVTWRALCELPIDKISRPTVGPDAGDRDRP